MLKSASIDSAMAEISVGLSFDDVLLTPGLSSVLPGEAELATHVTEGIPLFLPVVSAAMDTVSEHDLAIALAREGGMGVIHRACPIDEQVSMVMTTLSKTVQRLPLVSRIKFINLTAH